MWLLLKSTANHSRVFIDFKSKRTLGVCIIVLTTLNRYEDILDFQEIEDILCT